MYRGKEGEDVALRVVVSTCPGMRDKTASGRSLLCWPRENDWPIILSTPIFILNFS